MEGAMLEHRPDGWIGANQLYLYEYAIAIECCQSTICWSKSRWMGQGDMMGLQGCAAYRRICQTHLWPICSLHHKPAFETMVSHTSGTTTWKKSKSCKKSSVSNFNFHCMILSIWKSQFIIENNHILFVLGSRIWKNGLDIKCLLKDQE